MPEHVIIKEDIDIFLQSIDKVEACTSLDLGNVDNTSDLDKPVSSASQAQLDLKADKSDTYTKAEIDSEISTNVASSVESLVDSAPEALNTLNELAAALGDDENFYSTVTNSIAANTAALDLKVDISSFTARVNDYLSPQTLVSGPTVSYDCSNGVNAILTLTSDCLLENITNATAGLNGTLSIVQDSVGGHLLTLDSNYTIMNGDTVYTSGMLPNTIGKISWDTHDGVNFFLWVTT